MYINTVIILISKTFVIGGEVNNCGFGQIHFSPVLEHLKQVTYGLPIIFLNCPLLGEYNLFFISNRKIDVYKIGLHTKRKNS